MDEGSVLQPKRWSVTSEAMLRTVAEQLKLPLMQVARQAELARLHGGVTQDELLRMQTSADAALQMVDCYLLGMSVAEQGVLLEVEPVSVSSLFVETAHELEAFARQYKVDLALKLGGKYAPVMAHRAGLKAALLSLGYTMIEALPSLDSEMHRPQLSLAVHRTPKGISVGLYGEEKWLDADDLRKARELCGTAKQPLAAASSTSGAGVFVADVLFRAMHSQLRVGRYRNLNGLAATLQTSQQLRFV